MHHAAPGNNTQSFLPPSLAPWRMHGQGVQSSHHIHSATSLTLRGCVTASINSTTAAPAPPPPARRRPPGWGRAASAPRAAISCWAAAASREGRDASSAACVVDTLAEQHDVGVVQVGQGHCGMIMQQQGWAEVQHEP